MKIRFDLNPHHVLGFYTTWLLPIAISGVLFFGLGRVDPSYDDSKFNLKKKKII